MKRAAEREAHERFERSQNFLEKERAYLSALTTSMEKRVQYESLQR
jgi:hypothetical protein